jgi:hypothetical protein
MTVDTIARLLDENWHIAVVTNTEDSMLRTQRKIQKDSDDMFSRYRDDNGDMLFALLRTVEDEERCMELLAGGRR